MPNGQHHSQYPPQKPRAFRMSRTIFALMLREMSTTYGRSAFGYLWAILEPAAGIMLLTFVFSMAFRSPPIGDSFPLFYATGFLPFIAYMDISQKTSVALRFSRPLMAFPAVTYADALLARLLLNCLTQFLVFGVVLGAITYLYGAEVIINYPILLSGILMAFTLGFGIGVLNCFLLSMFPIWERTWAILTRPLFIISGIFFLPESVPEPFRSWVLYNPIVHVIGQVRRGVYQTYAGDYVSPIYVYGLSLTCLMVGLIFLRRYHRYILQD